MKKVLKIIFSVFLFAVGVALLAFFVHLGVQIAQFFGIVK